MRLKEKLIIKNFGPIKDVELEIKKTTVFIGEQGTGKSAISRLLYLLRYDQFIKELYSKKAIIEDWLNERDLSQYFLKKTEVYYETDYFSIQIRPDSYIINLNDNHIGNLLSTEKSLLNELANLNIPNERLRHQEISDLITYNDNLLGKIIGEVSFIPTERIIIPYLAVSAFSLNKVIETLPNYIQNAGKGFELFRVAFEREKINIDLTIILDRNVSFYYQDNVARIKKDGQDFTLVEAESGIQSLVPLLAEFETYKNFKRSWTYIVEEPELNLFPKTQYNLIKYLLSSFINREGRSIVITTHSPYILTSLNNLMYAYKVGQAHSKDADKIIGKKYWLNPDDVSAYMLLPNGECEDIFDREEGLIKAEKIDGVSTTINQEFDNLMNIEFAKV